MIRLLFFEELTVEVSEDGREFLYKNMLFSNKLSQKDLRVAFVSGTGINLARRYLWSQAFKRFAEYISDLREISCLDINAMARNRVS